MTKRDIRSYRIIGMKPILCIEMGNKKVVFYFSFPKDPKQRSLWTRNCRRVGFKPSNASRVCSMHFTENSYEPYAEHRKRRTLKRDAVPTLFDLPGNVQCKRKKFKPPPKCRASGSAPPIPIQGESSNKNGNRDFKFKSDHTYCLPDASRLIQAREKMLEELRSKARTIHSLQKNKFKNKKKILNLRSALSRLKKSGILNTNLRPHRTAAKLDCTTTARKRQFVLQKSS